MKDLAYMLVGALAGALIGLFIVWCLEKHKGGEAAPAPHCAALIYT